MSDWATGIASNTEGVVAVVNNVELSKQIQSADTLDQVRKSLAALWRDLLQRGTTDSRRISRLILDMGVNGGGGSIPLDGIGLFLIGELDLVPGIASPRLCGCRIRSCDPNEHHGAHQ